MINKRGLLRRTIPIMLLLNCGVSRSLLAQETGQTSGDSTSLNLTVFAQGSVFLKRLGWSAYAPLTFGTPVRVGDLIRLSETARAQIVCSDLTLHNLPYGTSGIPCPTSRHVLRRDDGSKINATRADGDDQSYPVMLTPRRTKLRSDHFVIRWSAVPGADGYRVVIRGSGFYAEQFVRTGTELRFPDQIPHKSSLKPGTDYKVIVQTGNRTSAAEPGVGLGFALLTLKERKIVEAEQKQIANLGLPGGVTQFLLGNIYAAHDLQAEAIEDLEETFKELRVAAVPRLLGDLYLKVGLIRQAEDRYDVALHLANSEGDLEGQLLAHRQLASIYERQLGNLAAASEHLNSMIALAHRIGDQQLESQAQNRLIALRPPELR